MAGLADAAAELEALAFRLRRAGDTELLREVTRAMRDAVDPVQDKIRADLKPRLPDRYAAELDADLRIGTNVRTNERDPGVAVTGQALGKTEAAGPGRGPDSPPPVRRPGEVVPPGGAVSAAGVVHRSRRGGRAAGAYGYRAGAGGRRRQGSQGSLSESNRQRRGVRL